MEYKILSIALIAVMMLSMIAMPLALAEETSVDNETQDTIVDVVTDTAETTSLIATNTIVDDTLVEESAEDDDATVGSGEILSTQVKSWFTFNQAKKAELELKLANMRLIQARIAAKNGNEKAMTKALEAHEKLINRVQERMGRIDGASDEKGLNASADKLVGLERAIQVHELKISRLSTLLENANLTEEQKAKIEAKIAKVQSVTSKLSDLSTQKKEEIKTRLMAVKGLTEEEADEVMSEKEDAIKAKVQERLQTQAGKA